MNVKKEEEFSDEQIARLDEIEGAAFEFLKVLAETDDICCDMQTIWNLIEEGAENLKYNYKRRVRIPTRVTEENGKTYITDYDDEIDYENAIIEKTDHYQ